MTTPGAAAASAEHDNARLTELVSAAEGVRLAALEARHAAGLSPVGDPAALLTTADTAERAAVDDNAAAAAAATKALRMIRAIAAAVRAHGANYLDTAHALDAARPLRRLLRRLPRWMLRQATGTAIGRALPLD